MEGAKDAGRVGLGARGDLAAGRAAAVAAGLGGGLALVLGAGVGGGLGGLAIVDVVRARAHVRLHEISFEVMYERLCAPHTFLIPFFVRFLRVEISASRA